VFAPPTPDGWYPDPVDPNAVRYWQSNAWTTWVSDCGQPRHQPLPTRTAVAPMVVLPPRALWWALGGFVVTMVLAAAATLVSDSLTVSLALGIVAIDVGLVGTAWLITNRYGTGSLADDLGLRFSRHDAAGGLATGVSARALAVAIAIVVLALTGGDIDNTDIQFDVFEDNNAALSLAALNAVFIAPVVEEIFFRGLLQRTLVHWIGVPAGIVAQAALFTLPHIQFDATGLENATLLAAVGVAGVVFGLAYQMTGRLGTSIIGHSLFNLVASIGILITR
jgi:CAAX protease family protein